MAPTSGLSRDSPRRRLPRAHKLPMPLTFATLADIDTRYPRELLTLAADETTGIRDDARIGAVLVDVSAEIRSILLARYRGEELLRLDQDALDVLRVHAIAMALYKVALSFARSSERLREGYDTAVKALQAIAAGKGALGIAPDPGAAAPEIGSTAVDNTAVLLEANERVFTRRRLRGL